MTLSSPLFDIFIHLFAGGAEAVCRSLSNEIKRSDVHHCPGPGLRRQRFFLGLNSDQAKKAGRAQKLLSKPQHFSNFITFKIALKYEVKMRKNMGSCINNFRLLASTLTYCAMCNHKQPSHFFWESTKKIKQAGLH